MKSRAVVQPATQKDTGKDSQVFFLSLKISLLIGSQIIWWLPVTVAIIGSFFDWAIPFLQADSLIGMIIPINSFLNPILHCKPIFTLSSSIIKNISQAIRRMPLLLKQNEGNTADVSQAGLEIVKIPAVTATAVEVPVEEVPVEVKMSFMITSQQLQSSAQ